MEDTLNSIKDCWEGSYLVLGNKGEMDAINAGGGISMMYVIIPAILIVFLIFFRREYIAVSASFVALFKKKKLREIEENQYISNSVNITAAVCSLFLPMILLKIIPSQSHAEYIIVLLLIVAYFILKYFLFKMVIWIKGYKETLRSVIKYSYICFIVFTVISLPVFVISYLFPYVDTEVIRYYLIVVFSILSILYYMRGYKIIISSGCPHFFWFLYLCTLELLPTGLLIGAFISL